MARTYRFHDWTPGVQCRFVFVTLLSNLGSSRSLCPKIWKSHYKPTMETICEWFVCALGHILVLQRTPTKGLAHESLTVALVSRFVIESHSLWLVIFISFLWTHRSHLFFFLVIDGMSKERKKNQSKMNRGKSLRTKNRKTTPSINWDILWMVFLDVVFILCWDFH